MLKRALVVAVTVGLALSGVSGNAAPKIKAYKPTASFSDRCANDPKQPKEWAALSKLQAETHRCQTPFRVVSKNLPKVGPRATLTSAANLLNPEQCKVADAGDDRDTLFNGWPATPARKALFDVGRYPSAKTVFQIVPIEAPDAPAGNQTPKKDYGKYFAWLKNYFTYISDYGASKNFRST